MDHLDRYGNAKIGQYFNCWTLASCNTPNLPSVSRRMINCSQVGADLGWGVADSPGLEVGFMTLGLEPLAAVPENGGVILDRSGITGPLGLGLYGPDIMLYPDSGLLFAWLHLE